MIGMGSQSLVTRCVKNEYEVIYHPLTGFLKIRKISLPSTVWRFFVDRGIYMNILESDTYLTELMRSNFGVWCRYNDDSVEVVGE